MAAWRASNELRRGYVQLVFFSKATHERINLGVAFSARETNRSQVKNTDITKSVQIKELQNKLDKALDEISSLRSKVKELETSVELTQNQQDEAKERFGKCEDEQCRQEDELIRQSIYSRRWNLIFHGIPETEGEDCLKHALVANLNLEEGKANSIMFCGTHRLGKKKDLETRPNQGLSLHVSHEGQTETLLGCNALISRIRR